MPPWATVPLHLQTPTWRKAWRLSSCRSWRSTTLTFLLINSVVALGYLSQVGASVSRSLWLKWCRCTRRAHYRAKTSFNSHNLFIRKSKKKS
jgi:hypothetical protein